MELVELDVGELGTGSESEGDSIASGDAGVGRVGVKVAGAAGGEEDGVGEKGFGVAVLVDDVEAGDLVVGEAEVGGEGVFEDGDAGVADGVDEGGFNREACGVAAGMEDAGAAVGGFAGLGELAVFAVKGDAEADEIADAVRAFIAEDLDGLGAAEPGAGA